MATSATPTTDALPEQLSAGTTFSPLAGPAMIAGGVLLVIAAGIGVGMGSSAEFWHAYLLNFAFVASLVIGGLFFTIACHLFGAYWATSVRRLAEIVAGTMPVIVLLFVPIAAFVLTDETGALYPWTAVRDVVVDGQPVATRLVEEDAILKSKAAYLSPMWFVIRAAIIFACWQLTAWFMVRGSLKVDKTGSVATLRRLARWSGPLMLVFALTLNFAAFDWLMSLDPVWFSTMFGVYYWVGCLLGFLALLTLMIHVLQGRGFLTQSVRVEQRHDIAKLMFAMVVFWGYITFSQFMLIWYANIPEETRWYAARGALAPLGISSMIGWLFVLHLLVPFLGFMSKRVRRDPSAMAFWSAYLLAVHWYDHYFIVMPTLDVTREFTGLEAGGAPPLLLEGLCLVGMALVLLGAIAGGTKRRWLAPIKDPRMVEALTYVNQ